ncbi:hepatic leukemia factor-like [Ptychodera flava]|uniref:hepatic leukemia factor-like n=1 Tax=Ptychodera flava TaxID=63121 RepID=UPI00396A2BF0
MATLTNDERVLKEEKFANDEKTADRLAMDDERDRRCHDQREIDEKHRRERRLVTEGRKSHMIAGPPMLITSSSASASIANGRPTFADTLNAISHKPLDLSYPKISSAISPYKLYPYPPTMPPSHPGIPPYSFSDPAALSAAAVAAYGAYPLYPSVVESAVTPSSVSNIKFPLSSLLRKRRSSDTSQQSQSSNSSQGSSAESQSNSSMPPQKKARAVPEEKKDAAYWERRRKNNDAAKRSRDARRAKEEEIALRAAFLEQENMKLRAEVSILKNELARLHYMVYSC